jgi:hypothetical protein
LFGRLNNDINVEKHERRRIVSNYPEGKGMSNKIIIIILLFLSFFLSFFPWTMNLSTADLRNYWTEFHETGWSYRYMFLVDPKVFRFVVKGVKAIFLRVQRGWWLL